MLNNSLSSVLDQTFQNWELIVWDDGSTDNTAQLVSAIGDERIHYHFEQNHGAAYARNRAMEKAQGCYLAFLDSDDEWLPDKLSQQVAVLESHPEIDCLFTDFLNINISKGLESSNFQSYQPAMAVLETITVDERLVLIQAGLLESLARGNFIATDTVMMRRALFKQLDPFNETLRNSEDFELWWRMGLAGASFAYLDQVLMRRYKPAGSLSSLSIPSVVHHLKALDLCSQAALQQNQNDLIKALRRPYRNAWHNMISACALEGDRAGMLLAFRQSLTYGFRPGALRLLWAGWRTLNTPSNPSDTNN